jgi:hypothetical protein
MNEDLAGLVIAQSLKNAQNLEIAYETNRNFSRVLDAIADEFYQLLVPQLTKRLSDLPGNWTISRSTKRLQPFNYIVQNDSMPSVEFGIRNYDQDKIHFYIEAGITNNAALYLAAQERFGGKPIGWMWYRKLDNPFNEWDDSFEGIFAYLEPTHAVEYVVDFLHQMAKFIIEFTEAGEELP